jgi:hypothetical protein
MTRKQLRRLRKTRKARKTKRLRNPRKAKQTRRVKGGREPYTRLLRSQSMSSIPSKTDTKPTEVNPETKDDSKLGTEKPHIYFLKTLNTIYRIPIDENSDKSQEGQYNIDKIIESVEKSYTENDVVEQNNSNNPNTHTLEDTLDRILFELPKKNSKNTMIL